MLVIYGVCFWGSGNGSAPGWHKAVHFEGVRRVTGIEMGEDHSPNFSMFQSSCAAIRFLGGYFLLGLALIKRKCWGLMWWQLFL